MLKLQITQDTWLKQSTQQAAQLPGDAKYFVQKGSMLAIRGHESIEDLTAQDDNDYHAVVNLEHIINGKRAWFVFQRHIAIMDDDQLLFPAPEVDDAKEHRAISRGKEFTGRAIALPSGNLVYTDQPIIAEGNFSWGEATHGGSRIPLTVSVEQNIIRLARELQEVRRDFGLPMTITSWHRPEPFNSRVGGARRSVHLEGGAVDFVIEGYRGRQIAQRVSPWWKGGIGVYPGNRVWICHLDIGPKRSWGF